jgi:hypothetical protein
MNSKAAVTAFARSDDRVEKVQYLMYGYIAWEAVAQRSAVSVVPWPVEPAYSPLLVDSR